MDSSNLSLTSALDVGGWLTPRPGRFTPRKETRYPFYSRLGGPRGRSGRVRKLSPPPGFNPRTVQPVASNYSVYALGACNTFGKEDKRLESFNGKTWKLGTKIQE
jgi:hypothetical protein